MIGHSNVWRALGVWMLTACLVLATAGAAQAQLQPAGNLFGTVTDQQGSPLPGATVTLTGRGAPQVQVTNAQGQFRFLGLPPGSYSLKTELEGFSTVDYPDIAINVGRNTTIEVTQSAAVEDVITVTSESPLLDERRISTGTTVSQEELERIPTARDPWAILQQTPGVLTDRINVGGNESGQQSSYVAGVQKDQNTWAVDGVVITDMAALGSSPAYYDFDSFEEMQVTTGGNDSTIATGGVVLNMVTKRGTNEWRGSGRYLLGDDAWNSDHDESLVNSPGAEFTQGNRIVSVQDYGAELGGPMVKDRLWIWGSYGAQNIDLLDVSDVSDFTELETANVKLNAQITPSNSATFFAMHNGKEATGIGRDAARRSQETTWNQDKFGDTAFKLEDTHIFNSNFYLTGLYSHVDGGFQLVPAGGLNTTATFSESGGGTWFNTYSLNTTDRRQDQYRADASYFFNTGSLSHELKFGAGHRSETIETLEAWPGAGIHFDDTRFNVSDTTRSTTTTYTSAWIQDTLNVGNLTANIGLRYDKQGGSDEGQRSAHPTLSTFLPGVSFPRTDADFEWTSVVPRLGLTYAMGEDGDTLFSASYSEYVQQLTKTFVQFGQPAGMDLFAGSPVFSGSTFLGIVPPQQNLPAAREPANIFAEDLDAPIQSDLIFGIEHALLPEFVVGLNLTVRQVDDILFNFPLGRTAGGPERVITGDDYFFVGQVTANVDGDTRVQDLFDVVNSITPTDRDIVMNSGVSSEYMGVSLTFNKRLANRWMLRGHFTWQDWEWNVTEEAAERFDPTRILQRPIDGERIAPSSVSNFDVRLNGAWSYSVDGLYQVAPDRPWGFNVATNIWGRQGFPDDPWRSISRTNGSDVTVNFGNDTRLENIHFVDARVDKEFTFGDCGLILGVDVFNLFNQSYVAARNGNLDQGHFVGEVTSPRVIRIGARMTFR